MSVTRSGTNGKTSGSCESRITGASGGTPASALGRSGRRRRRSARPATWKLPTAAARFSSTSMPASSSARHISWPACFQSWLPSTAKVPSGARSAASSRAICSGVTRPPHRKCESMQSPSTSIRSGASALRRSTARAIAFGPTCGAPAWMSDTTPRRMPSSAAGQRGSSSVRRTVTSRRGSIQPAQASAAAAASAATGFIAPRAPRRAAASRPAPRPHAWTARRRSARTARPRAAAGRPRARRRAHR